VRNFPRTTDADKVRSALPCISALYVFLCLCVFVCMCVSVSVSVTRFVKLHVPCRMTIKMTCKNLYQDYRVDFRGFVPGLKS